tara:strand:- start:1172 stop:2224 length:1053 start_codon:yes stop_codon:yes gene_type:complete
MPVINGYSRLTILAFALGASALTFMPIGDVLGDDVLFSQLAAVLLLGAASALPWLIITRAKRLRLITSITACLIAILPPFGTISAPNPFMAAGYLFPGTGVIGLLLMASIIILPYQFKTNVRKYFFGVIIAISAISNLAYTEPLPPTDWVALKTTFHDHYLDPIQERNKRSRALIAQITSELDKGQKVIIAPESVLGLRTKGLEPQLDLIEARARRNQAIVLVGVIEGEKGNYKNSLLILGDKSDRYQARQPVPFIMWNLWQGDGFKSSWFESGVQEIAGRRTAMLICWEEWVPWPMLRSAWEKPEVIISASNHGWASEGQYMWKRQSISAKALSRLYGLPMVRAVNLPD